MMARLLAVALLLAPSSLAAQSLGEVAAREEKKAGRPPAARVYTNEDLERKRAEREPSRPPLGAPGARAGEAPVTSPTPPPERTPEPVEPSRDVWEAQWRARAEQARLAVSEAEERVKQLERDVAALRTDTSPTNLLDPNRLQSQQAELGRALETLEVARAAATAARNALGDLEDEARRAGVPPGWLRER